MTITEALAEIKTVGKRIEKKRQAIQVYHHHAGLPREGRRPAPHTAGSRAGGCGWDGHPLAFCGAGY